MLSRPLALLVLTASLAGAAAGYRQTPARHDSRVWSECQRCRTAYRKAMDHTLNRLPQASFPARMIMGWLLLADGSHKQDLDFVVREAMQWQQRVGEIKPHNHRRNWYPALAGILLAEVYKYQPSRQLRDAMAGIVEHFAGVQEVTGGWFKWHEGAYKDRLDYPVKDLGILNAMIFGFLCSARTHGIDVPADVLKEADLCLHRIVSSNGISYGTGSRGGDLTGARGGFALLGLMYAQEKKHEIAKVYADLLPRQIPNLDQGHHVGALHCLGVTLGCHLLGPGAYRELTDCWLDPLIDKQQEDGGIYVGDDGDAGGEEKLLGEDDGSTAAVALLILLQDPSRLQPAERPAINWAALDIDPPASRRLQAIPRLAAQGKLVDILDLCGRLLEGGGRPDPVETEEARRIQRAVLDHAHARLGEGEALVRDGDLLLAAEIFAALVEAMEEQNVGQAAARNLAAFAKGGDLQQEYEAARALREAWTVAYRKGLRKARNEFEKVVGRYAGTRAAREAEEVLAED